VKFIKRESVLKTIENKGFFQRCLHIFSTKRWGRQGRFGDSSCYIFKV